METCGYVCEGLGTTDDLGEEQTNGVLTAIIDGTKAARPDATRFAAVVALKNMLPFCSVRNLTL